jgi:hypothetical protein
MHYYSKDELLFLFCALFNCIPGLFNHCTTSRKSRKALVTPRSSRDPLHQPDIETQAPDTPAKQQP